MSCLVWTGQSMHVKLGDIDDIWLFSLGIGFIINGCMKLIYCIDSTFIPGISIAQYGIQWFQSSVSGRHVFLKDDAAYHTKPFMDNA